MKNQNTNYAGIVYSCYHQKSREAEHLVAEHVLTFQISGTSVVSDGNTSFKIEQGSTVLYVKNQLLKFEKHPPVVGDYQSISIFLDRDLLKSFSLDYEIHVQSSYHKDSLIDFGRVPSLSVFFNSVRSYIQNGGLQSEQFIAIKQKELLLLVMQYFPDTKDILFDFTEPHKIDLEAFMNKNFSFNLRADRFAYLTGRSLASFKRDFEKIFGTSPRKWLQEKRLKEAFYLITEKGKTPSAIYLDLGFENLSHFSYAFKKKFGVSPNHPSTLKRHIP